MILLVDNNDSYTFNLAHLIARTAGEFPAVVRAGDVDKLRLPERLAAGEFTHVVISPGPGNPTHEEDFAGSRAVIEASAGLPLLGVCLGHQGLAHLAGLDVARTEPRHGHLSTVTHSGEGVFAGLPQPLQVVRYHSLHVDVPEDSARVAVHARSEDGIVQGINIRGTDHWGVQFHPESVLTAGGEQLLRNFLALAPVKAREHNRMRLMRRIVAGPLDTEATFRRLAGPEKDAVWLESATGDGFSILAAAGGSWSRTFRYSVGDETPFTERLRTELSPAVHEDDAPELPFRGGLLGYLTYECAASGLPGFRPRHRNPYPDSCFLRPQAFIVHDHAGRSTHLCALHEDTDAGRAEARELLTHLEGALAREGDEAGGASISEGAWRMSRGDYDDSYARVRAALAAGDSYEICLTDVFTATANGTGLDLYSRLRRANPAPYAAYLHLGGIEVLSSSPEKFLTVNAGHVETSPIKGTVARSQSPALLDDAKTRAENLMIVDLMRNDLGRVCEPGSVTVPRLMAVETYATVHQLVSTVAGTLRTDVDLPDLLRATLPAGSMTGAPKERTCAIIDAIEAGPRGVYSGVIGHVDFDGNADLSVAIRTAVKQGSEIRVGAGGAIVWDSTADAEYDEMLLKARAVTEGLQ